MPDEFSLTGILKLFAAANAFVFLLLLFFAIKPIFVFGVFGIVVDDWRYAYGCGGWVVQHSKTYEVNAKGYFPWYEWWFERWFEKHYGRKPNLKKDRS